MNMFKWRKKREVNLKHLKMSETKRHNSGSENGSPGSQRPQALRVPKNGLGRKRGEKKVSSDVKLTYIFILSGTGPG